MSRDEITLIEVEHVQTTTRVFAALAWFGSPIAAITVDENLETVEMVFVSKDFRRKGIATKLLLHAREVTGLKLDMDSGDRSPDGRQWAKAMGLQCQGRVRGYKTAEPDGSRLLVAVTQARQCDEAQAS